MRVLVVDDCPFVRRALARVLGGAMTAATVEEALDAAEDEQPDVIVLDHALDLADGIEAIPALRELAPHAAVMVFAAHTTTQARRRALDLGADAYVDKIHVAKIRELVREIYADSRERRSARAG